MNTRLGRRSAIRRGQADRSSSLAVSRLEIRPSLEIVAVALLDRRRPRATVHDLADEGAPLGRIDERQTLAQTTNGSHLGWITRARGRL
ncbi:hypothetical protein [Halostagnicola kamekurae]|uniref:hypothetical protein n=1 Tax=Halostagnicola kamekurae TaxID=619731 RepID=UPI00111460FE|nr:hypothetical protein [Halostagnicola kamekurae]